MTKLEKVIKGLERCFVDNCTEGSKCPYYNGEGDCINTLLYEALKLLKEWEPVEPTLATDTWICSCCGHTLESQELIDDKENPQVLVHETYSFCPNCGRAVKWDEPPKEGAGE